MNKTAFILLTGVFFLIMFSGGMSASAKSTTSATRPAPEQNVNVAGGYLEQCGDARKSRQVSCLAFAAGIYEGLISLQNNLLMQKLPSPEEARILDAGDKQAARDTFLALSRRYGAFCAPTGLVSYARVQDILLRFIRENPQYQDMSTGDMFIAALAKTYPCEAPKTVIAPGPSKPEPANEEPR